MVNLQNALISQWYQPKKWGWLLWPFTQIFQFVVYVRQYCYKKNIFASYKAEVPVIVVGNITVGGTGKTPLVIHLSSILQQKGLRPGIVLRGYKSNAHGALLVDANSDPQLVGDEAVLLARRSQCPVVISKKRTAGVKKLINEQNINIILCDDGLQHYALQRDLEIAVIDGERGFGNGHCLPMGPLRELPDRLKKVDMTIINGSDMQLVYDKVHSLLYPKRVVTLQDFVGKEVHAIAGIGTPEKFFQMLRQVGIIVIPHEFPDHHAFKMADINFSDHLPVLMTEKDAVKCRYFANDQHWAVAVSTVLADNIRDEFCKLVDEVVNGR